ncbi:phage major capsid protein [Methylopila sp. 73B]|uniref:phage major capsid protein n=1 Tax=Methylopila sp. 73B TaxID=1120792 RepID=UPI00039E7069|nr:phage major capsid protein [Methylopila sp. 73B]
MSVEHRTTVSAGDGYDFVISDGSRDTYGTRINPNGWDLRRFIANPIAFFGHAKSDPLPIGTWSNLRVENGQLRGRLKLAAPGTSKRVDEYRTLIEQDILRGVSAGFHVIEHGKPGGPYEFERQELLEASLAAVPSNKNALALARSLNVSDDTLNLVFGRTADADVGMTGRGLGEIAANPPVTPHRRSSTVSNPLAQRIVDAQERVVALRDQLTDHLATVDDLNPDEASKTVTDELNQRIASQESHLATLRESEARLAATSEPAAQQRTAETRRPFAVPAVKVDPKSYAYRAATIKLLSHIERKPVDLVRQERYGDDEPTKVVTGILTRAATAPATTTTSGWASQLVETVNADFMEDLMPASVYPGLSARGLRLNFGRAVAISIPSRSATPTIAGSFVGEGAPIPVRQGAFTSTTLTPKKMAVISTFTREIAEHSTPAIEGLIRNAIQEDTAVAIDTVLLDATAASSIRPAGIRNGVTVTTATAGGGFAALVGDIKALVGALITATNGSVRSPVWIMNPVQAISIALTQNAGGDFPFANEINGNRLQGYPVIQSASVAAGRVILVDAADFVSVTGDEPRFDVSDQATLHMEDTTPLAIGATGTPNTIAAPVRSLFQTDSIGIRMILPMNWGFRRAGVLAWTESVSW